MHVDAMDPELPDEDALAQALRELGARYPTLAFAADVVTDNSGLAEDEALCALDFVPHRRAQFAAGRRAARKALSSFGLGLSSVVATARGVPVFPPRYCGSITHKGRHAVAVAGAIAHVASVGIDLEFDVEPEESVLLGRVCTESEARVSDQLVAVGLESPATLFLCAKEALFKALNPLDGVARDFQEVEVAFDVDGSFAVALVEPQQLARRIVGRYARCGAFLVSVAIVEPCCGV
jgi:4'-phosphopantetheinyl transferase EntD